MLKRKNWIQDRGADGGDTSSSEDSGARAHVALCFLRVQRLLTCTFTLSYDVCAADTDADSLSSNDEASAQAGGTAATGSGAGGSSSTGGGRDSGSGDDQEDADSGVSTLRLASCLQKSTWWTF